MMMDEHVVEYVSGLPAVKSVTNGARWRDLAPEGDGKSGGPASPAARRHGVSSIDLALLGVVFAQEERINALERHLGHVAAVLQGMGMDA